MAVNRDRLGILLAAGLLLVMAGTRAAVVDRPFFRVLGLVVVWAADDWAENGGQAPVAVDFLLMNGASGSPGNDIIAADGVALVRGTLDPAPGVVPADRGNMMRIANVAGGGGLSISDNNNDGYLDAGDSLASFGLTSSTDVRIRAGSMVRSFFIASSVPFAIHATASNLQTSGDFSSLTLANIRWNGSFRRSGNDGLAYGSRAQLPHSGGSSTSGVASPARLDTFNNKRVFEGDRRTADQPGTLAQQSVRFSNRYLLRRNATGGGSYDLSMGTGHIEADVLYTIYVP